MRCRILVVIDVVVTVVAVGWDSSRLVGIAPVRLGWLPFSLRDLADLDVLLAVVFDQCQLGLEPTSRHNVVSKLRGKLLRHQKPTKFMTSSVKVAEG